MQIRDLEHWPPSVWVTTGSTRLIPDLAAATIKSVHADGECVFLRFADGGKAYGTALVLSNKHLARCVNFTLKKAIGKTTQNAGELEVEQLRYIDMDEE
jgi:hypothetical protein